MTFMAQGRGWGAWFGFRNCFYIRQIFCTNNCVSSALASNGPLVPLPAPCVDTGMGFEVCSFATLLGARKIGNRSHFFLFVRSIFLSIFFLDLMAWFHLKMKCWRKIQNFSLSPNWVICWSVTLSSFLFANLMGFTHLKWTNKYSSFFHSRLIIPGVPIVTPTSLQADFVTQSSPQGFSFHCSDWPLCSKTSIPARPPAPNPHWICRIFFLKILPSKSRSAVIIPLVQNWTSNDNIGTGLQMWVFSYRRRKIICVSSLKVSVFCPLFWLCIFGCKIEGASVRRWVDTQLSGAYYWNSFISGGF